MVSIIPSFRMLTDAERLNWMHFRNCLDKQIKSFSIQSDALNPLVKSLTMISNGWLFDIYHLKDRIVLWIKEKNERV